VQKERATHINITIQCCWKNVFCTVESFRKQRARACWSSWKFVLETFFGMFYWRGESDANKKISRITVIGYGKLAADDASVRRPVISYYDIKWKYVVQTFVCLKLLFLFESTVFGRVKTTRLTNNIRTCLKIKSIRFSGFLKSIILYPIQASEIIDFKFRNVC